MKPITKTTFTIFIVLVLAGISIIAVNSFFPFINNDAPPLDDADDNICVHIIFVDLDGNKVVYGDVMLQSGSLEFVIAQFDSLHDNFSIDFTKSDLYGTFYNYFEVNGVTYGGGDSSFIALYSNDEESTSPEWSIVVDGTTYYSLSLGASSTQVVDEATYVIAVGVFG